MKIAIMQPYYYPYAGYFRLFATTDVFVVLDDVQWNRRGRVHRRTKPDGTWDTLPIQKTARDTTMIKDLQWQEGASKECLPFVFIMSGIADMCRWLNIPFNWVLSSRIPIDTSVKGQDRIIAICQALKATEYINSPGGRYLYDEQTFKDNGIKLTFLPDWKGSYYSILDRANEPPEAIRKEIYEQL